MKKKLITFLVVFIILIAIGIISFIFYNKDDDILYVIGESIENGVYDERGYYLEKTESKDYPYRYYIAMGEKNTGGYSIKVKEVSVDSNKVTIIVDEKSPNPNDIVIQTLTSPICYVDLKSKPNKIIIKNTNGDKFKHIKL